jgi:hypothetical protein
MKRAALVVALIAIAAVFLLFYRMGRHDKKALNEFVSSYEKFDEAILGYSAGHVDGFEGKAGAALAELEARAAERLSSLMKNDAELMAAAHMIAIYSAGELDNLYAYKRAIQNQNAGLEELVKEHGDWTAKRKAAYDHYREMSGLGK